MNKSICFYNLIRLSWLCCCYFHRFRHLLAKHPLVAGSRHKLGSFQVEGQLQTARWCSMLTTLPDSQTPTAEKNPLSRPHRFGCSARVRDNVSWSLFGTNSGQPHWRTVAGWLSPTDRSLLPAASVLGHAHAQKPFKNTIRSLNRIGTAPHAATMYDSMPLTACLYEGP